jgi:zinc transport system substrate-binding protein
VRLRVLRPAAGLLVVGLAAVLATSAPARAAEPRAVDARGEPRLRVAAAFFPLAAVARTVGGAGVEVDDLTPPGVDAHDVEATTDQVDLLLDADLAIVLGGSFQPAIERVAARRDGPTLVWREVLDRASARRLDRDPHLWLDPVRYAALAKQVGNRLARLDPDHARGYQRRVAASAAALEQLDATSAARLSGCSRNLLVTSHESFGWLASRYGLRQVGVTRGSPDAEPDPARVADLADRARRAGVTTVFSEPLLSDRVARTLAREAGGLRVVDLDPLEGLRGRRGSVGDGSDYLRVMARNLERIAAALGCP